MEYSIDEIKVATKNFHPSHHVGTGACAEGHLRHTKVAIKRVYVQLVSVIWEQ